MPEYHAPGIHIDEVRTGARPIEIVDTTTAAFFGATSPAAPFREPVLITSRREFERHFLPDTAAAATNLDLAIRGFFTNGGARVYVVGLGPDADRVTAEDLALLEPLDDVSLIAAPGFTDPESSEALIAHCEALPYRFAVLDMADTGNLMDIRTPQATGGLKPRDAAGGRAAVYIPWLHVTDAITGATVPCPPSGHVCGIYARTYTAQGVYMAPANEVVEGALSLTQIISFGQQEVLNPENINCIRILASWGIRVWGGRTLTTAGDFERYVNTRRTMSMIQKSLDRATQWVVFEQNDDVLWKSVTRDIDGFLDMLWRSGVLLGTTPDEAFFVKCDRTTMTQDDLDTGRLVCEIGVALMRPAEFAVFRIGHHTGGAAP